jgi:hypothetical protein
MGEEGFRVTRSSNSDHVLSMMEVSDHGVARWIDIVKIQLYHKGVLPRAAESISVVARQQRDQSNDNGRITGSENLGTGSNARLMRSFSLRSIQVFSNRAFLPATRSDLGKHSMEFYRQEETVSIVLNAKGSKTADVLSLPVAKEGVTMSGWTTAQVNGVWRTENPDYRGHRLTVYRCKAPGAYRAYLGGRLSVFWKSKEAAKEAAEKAALARNIDDRLRGTTEA